VENPLLIATRLEGRHWVDVLDGYIDPDTYKTLLSIRSTKVLSLLALIEVIGKRKAREFEKYANEQGIFAEIGEGGVRRCVYVKGGKRCKCYNKGIMCIDHYEEVRMFTKFFQSVEFRQRFEAFKRSPQSMQLKNEQALMRVLITELVQKMGKPGDVPIELIGGLTTMIDKLTNMTEKMAKMNEITPESVENLLDKVVDILCKFVPAEKLQEASAEVAKLSIVKIEPEEEYDEGLSLEYDNKPLKITATKSNNEDIRQRAFLDSARKLGLSEADIEDINEVSAAAIKSADAKT
jgi:hypothetical protein